MNGTKRSLARAATAIALCMLAAFICAGQVGAVPLTTLIGGGALPATSNWTQLPPYNLLWPLWSPVLSPVDPITGLPTPIVSSVSNSTILPIQPALFWDPARQYPFLLYNIPQIFGGGLTFFDAYYGLNPWPPSYLVDPVTGLPAPITPAAGFAALSPTAILPGFLFTGNLLYSEQYGIPVTNLLTAGDIWGLAPLAGLLPVI